MFKYISLCCRDLLGVFGLIILTIDFPWDTEQYVLSDEVNLNILPHLNILPFFKTVHAFPHKILKYLECPEYICRDSLARIVKYYSTFNTCRDVVGLKRKIHIGSAIIIHLNHDFSLN